MTENKFKIGFTPKGEYSNSVTYSTLDVVSYNNGAYVSIVDENLGNLPTKETYWKILVNPTTINNAVASSTTATNAAISATNLAINAANAANAAIVDINDIISKKIDTKFGFQRAVANTEAGTYTIQSFGTSTDADKYDEDPVTNLGLLINSYQILMGSGTGGGGSTVIYTLKCINNLPSLYFSAAKNEEALIKFTFTSKDSDGNNTNEGGTCHVFVKNTVHTTYTEVESFSVVSNVEISHDVSSFLADGYNNIMIKIDGEVSELTTAAVVYSITLTTLSLDISSFQWWLPKTSDFILPCTIAGNVNKILHVVVTGTNYSQEYVVNLGTTTYTDTTYNYTVVHPGVAGIFKIQAYLINSDGTVKTKTSEYEVMCRIAGDTSKLLVVNNVLSKAINWSNNTLLSYAMCDGDNQTSSVEFEIKKDTTILYSPTESIQTGIKYDLLYTMEVETATTDNFNISVDATDGTNLLINTLTIPVDNSLSFSATPGYLLYINPKNRSNTQSNYKSIVNEATNTEISATWTNMNWSTDGWIDNDNNAKILRLLSNSSVNINTQLLATECATTGKTIEIKANIKNISDYSQPWLVLGANNTQNNFVGIKIYPDKALWYTQLKHDEETQSYMLDDTVDIHIVFCVVPNTYGNVGYNTVYMYVDGKKCRAFNYENSDLFSTNSNLIIGSTGCDVDIYAIRSYNLGLSSAGVLENYMNLLPTRAEKESVRNYNDILNSTQTELDFTKIKNVKRCFVFDKPLPNKENQANVTGTIQVIYPEDSTRNVTITNVTAAGQGSTSKGYYEWNIKFTINSNSVFTFANGTTQTGGKWKIDPTQLAGTKFTAKLNWASMSQDHKCGSVNAYTDLYKKLGLTNPAIQANPLVRVSVYEQPYVGFCKQTNEDGEDVYTFQGEYTWGADKGDKYCFGYDTTAFPNLIAIEGSDNAPLPALYRVPWNTDRITYQVIDSQNIDGWVYNGASAFDFDSGTTSKISQFIPAYNLVHSCSNLIAPFNGTLDELNAQVTTYRNTQYMYWISKTGDTNYGNLYYYEAGEQLYIGDDIGDGTINLFTQLVDKGYGLLTADISGKTDTQLNTLFINARIRKAYLEWGQYWDINDALFHDCWVEITAGTDQRAKNTYPYIFGTDTDKKVRWRVDDMDTIWPTNNQGLLTKNYSTEVGDKYEDGAPEWNGETSVFHNVLALAFKVEMSAMMARVITAMEELGGATTGTDYDKLLAWYQKYYIDVKTWFPTNIINEFGKHFEKAELKYKVGTYQSDTEPISQIVGDAMSPDLSFVKKRLVYLMSKYSLGLFSAKSSGAITVRAAGDEITYDLTPAIDLYPTVANGESIIRGDRTFAGNPCQMVINLGGSSDQQNTILGSDYLTDIGDWHNKNVHGALSITGKRLTQILLGSKTVTPIISITSLSLGNCYSLKKLEMSGISTLQGTLDLTSCKGLKEVYANGTSLTNIELPDGGMLTNIEYPSTEQQVFLKNFNSLTTANINLNSASVRLLWLENMANVDSYTIAKQCLQSLSNIRLLDINSNDEELFELYTLSLLGGIDNSGNNISKAVLAGSFHVIYANRNLYNYFVTNFPDLTITYDSIYDQPVATFNITDGNGNALSGATVTIGSDILTTDSTGACQYQTISSLFTVTVSKSGYESRTLSISIGRFSKTFSISIKTIYSITFNVSSSQYGFKIKNCAITIDGETKATDSSGVAIFYKVAGNYTYTAAYSNETTKTGTVSISSSNQTISISFIGDPNEYKPTLTGNVQLAITGSSVTLAGINNTSVPLIDWGDGNSTQTTGVTSYSHTYSTSAIWNIEIKNAQTVTTLTIPTNIFALWSLGSSQIKNLSFYNCYSLVIIGENPFVNDWNRTSFSDCFSGSYYLTSIPEKLFDNCVNVTDFSDCFRGCSSLTTIPVDLFKYNINVTTFRECFYGCGSITTIPTDLFKYNTKVTSIFGCFGDCQSITAIPTGLFDNCVNVTSFYDCFRGCSKLTTIPTGLFDNCVNVTDFNWCFNECSSLTTIPTDLFKYNTKVTTFNACFRDCSSLTTIPTGLFDNCVNVTDFSDCFRGCSSLTTIPVDLFKYNINVTNFRECFANCQSITTIPTDLFKYNTKVTTFNACFRGCSKLTTIPTGLFDNCVNVTDFSYCFYSSYYNLAVIPVDLFKYNINVTNFSDCFANCQSITTIPDGLFDNCVNVTNFNECFSYCIKLTHCILPISFSNLGSYTYSQCTGLQYIKTTLTTPQTIGSNIFYNTNNCPIYVPADCVNTYKAASGWSSYASRIQAIPS